MLKISFVPRSFMQGVVTMALLFNVFFISGSITDLNASCTAKECDETTGRTVSVGGERVWSKSNAFNLYSNGPLGGSRKDGADALLEQNNGGELLCSPGVAPRGISAVFDNNIPYSAKVRYYCAKSSTDPDPISGSWK